MTGPALSALSLEPSWRIASRWIGNVRKPWDEYVRWLGTIGAKLVDDVRRNCVREQLRGIFRHETQARAATHVRRHAGQIDGGNCQPKLCPRRTLEPLVRRMWQDVDARQADDRGSAKRHLFWFELDAVSNDGLRLRGRRLRDLRLLPGRVHHASRFRGSD